ncbi:MAG: neutral/alkaline non-lysosomal ceramidase N-terminal domain-containing protein, partial [Planctomycetota bacterium]|nr:neutral/alkaline non-lysosomal ceramidase N-terminal domain-containing protein [Planctomycetota bacterium]
MSSTSCCQAVSGSFFSLPRTLSRLIAVMAFAGVLLLTQTASLQAGWKAGLSKAELTPRTDVWLAGYGSKRVATETLHPLWMKALALDDGAGHQVVLITSDFQGVPKGMSDRVFEQVKKKHGLQRHQIMFTFSHNHCGPRLGEDLIDYYQVEEAQEELVRKYTDRMVIVSVDLIGRALADLKPATIHTGQGRSTFAVNRRNNREADVPALLAAGKALVGPVDHTVPVMTITGKDDNLRAILFGYACHPTTLSFTKWCG